MRSLIRHCMWYEKSEPATDILTFFLSKFQVFFLLPIFCQPLSTFKFTFMTSSYSILFLTKWNTEESDNYNERPWGHKSFHPPRVEVIASHKLRKISRPLALILSECVCVCVFVCVHNLLSKGFLVSVFFVYWIPFACRLSVVLYSFVNFHLSYPLWAFSPFQSLTS